MQFSFSYIIQFFLAVLFLSGCSSAQNATNTHSYEVVNSFPHDERAFTQGLLFADGYLYESTGKRGRSSVRKVEIETGKVTQKWNFPGRYFGEGLVKIDDELLALTWQSGEGHRLDFDTFKYKGKFSYNGEGWGITSNGNELFMSDGTSQIQIRNKESFAVTRRITVMAEGRVIPLLNELEWVEGEIWANVWKSFHIARIDPKSGKVKGWIDLSNIYPRTNNRDAVLNGIAYDPKTKRIFVTGKYWPSMFEIKLVKK